MIPIICGTVQCSSGLNLSNYEVITINIIIILAECVLVINNMCHVFAKNFQKFPKEGGKHT